MPTFRNIELARAGTWDLAVGGRQTFTGEDFADAVAASEDPEILAEVGIYRVRPGHDDPRFDGSPSFGRLANFRVVGDRLLADWIDVPWSIAAGVQEEYPERSIEGWRDVTTASGRHYGMIVTGMALLGLTPPAISGLAPLPDAVAASQRVEIAAASGVMGLSNTAEPEASASTSATPAETCSIVFANRAESRPTGEPMDLTALRQALGLGDDATEAEILAAAATAAGENASLTARVTELEETAPPPPAPTGSPPAVPDGAVVVDAGQWDEIQQEIAASRADRQTRAQAAEEDFIVRARRQGRLGPATNPNSQRLEAGLRREFQRNQGEAEAFMASLAQVVPTSEVGHAEGAEMTSDDAVYAALYGAEG